MNRFKFNRRVKVSNILKQWDLLKDTLPIKDGFKVLSSTPKQTVFVKVFDDATYKLAPGEKELGPDTKWIKIADHKSLEIKINGACPTKKGCWPDRRADLWAFEHELTYDECRIALMDKKVENRRLNSFLNY